MRWFHGVRWLVVSGACIGVIATACGGDGETSSGGSAGTQAMAGQPDGTGNTGNAAGEQSTGGTDNKAGSSNGGSSMSSAGDTGTAGDSMASGGAGGAAATEVAMCQEACKKDGDCLPNNKCVDARCVSTAPPPAGCKSDDVCKAQLSGWTTECNEQSDCLITQACVDIGEKMGRCATKSGGAISCDTLMQQEIATKDFDGKDVKVCGKERAECGADGACREPCVKDSCPANFACNEKTGNCECDNDTACAGQPNVSKCEAGRCVCAGDGDCKLNSNKCVAGTCGCGDASVCTGKTTNPGTSWVCE